MHVAVAELLAPVTQAAEAWLGESWVDIPAFVLFFGAVFLGSLAFWRLAWRLPMPKASLLASCCMSVAHALVVCVVGFQQLQEWKHFDLDMPNTAQHVLLVEFSFAYMLADFFMYLIPFTPNDYIFITHHVISSFFIVGVLHFKHSAIACILMFWMGEVTSPLLNTFTISRELRHTSKAAYAVFQYSSPLFTISYILVRSILAPPLVFWFVYSLWFRASAIPLGWRIPMGSCVLVGILGSQLWTLKLVKGYMRHKAKGKAA